MPGFVPSPKEQDKFSSEEENTSDSPFEKEKGKEKEEFKKVKEKKSKQKKSPLDEWLIKRNFKTTSRQYTHLMLNGGKINIPEEHAITFLQRYAEDIKNGEKHFICELKTEKFKFFSDLDFLEIETDDNKNGIPDNVIIDYISTIQTVIHEFYKDYINPVDLFVMVCCAKAKKKVFQGQNYIKTGVHLIWPKVFTTKQTALLLRYAIVKAMELAYDPRPSFNSWAEVVDTSVYNANGLRMIGSKKIEACKVCKGTTEKLCGKKNCILFNKTRKLYENRAYSIKYVINSDEDQEKCFLNPTKLQFYLDSTFECIRDASIRLNYTVPESAFNTPIWVQYKNKPNARLRSKKLQKLPSKEDIEGLKSIGQKELLGDTSKAKGKITRFLKNNLPSEYKGMVIKDIYKLKVTGYYCVRTDSHYCMNLKGEHNSNTIWFLITPQGVSQRCFCRCDTTERRYFGYCKDFKSKPMKLSIPLKNELFPNSKSKVDEEYKFKVRKSTDDRMSNLMDRLKEQL